MQSNPMPRQEIMKQIMGILSLSDDTLLTDVDAFWQQVALSLGESAVGDAEQIARGVIDSLSLWDEDYLMEDDSALSDQAYLEVLDKLNELTGNALHPLNLEDREGDLTLDDEEIDDSTSWQTIEYGVAAFQQPDADTLLSWIYKGDVIVNPEWQRNFVWPLKKQRAFIESILMGLPIPSLLLYEDRSTHRKYIIDGRQRLETLTTFCASPENRSALGFLGRKFKTFPTTRALWREGEPLFDAAGKYFDKLPEKFQRTIRGTSLTVFTFRGLTRRQLYQIFQRYNTGAEKLRAAEIRNAVYQDHDVHKLLWRMAGESPERAPFFDSREQDVAETLRNIMRNKVARYGAYDFLGRVFAFTYVNNGKSVAVATNDFLDKFAGNDLEPLRQSFLDAFEAVTRWYKFPLTTPAMNGKFHGFLGTIQLATAHHMLELIKLGKLTEEEVARNVDSAWIEFSERTLEMKQNSTNFWAQQDEWRTQLASSPQG